MRKGKTVIGQGVFSLEDGVRIDSVKDLLINEDNDAIVALLVSEGGLMASSTVIPVEHVDRFGPSAVMVSARSAVVEADGVPEVRQILDRNATLLGSAVLTRDGDDLGRISDMYFDERSGRIQGFEVSGGRVGDMMRGTSYLRLAEIDVVGPDAVITKIEAKEHLEEQKGGLEGAVEDAQGRVGELQEQAQGRAGEVQRQVQGAAETAGDPDGTLVGRRARSDVADRTGSIIVANGQRIDLEDVRQSRDAGTIDDLYASAGIRRQRSAGEQAGDAVDDLGNSARDLWERFTQRISELTDDAGRRMDAEGTRRRLAQIHDAIGRPVTKAILDRQDDVILDVGDLVTHQAVQRAHENGMLDSMLDSVYVAEVTFDREELKARIPGDSRVEDAKGGAHVVDELEQRRADMERPALEEQAGKEDDDSKAEATRPEPSMPEVRAATAGRDVARQEEPQAATAPASGQRQSSTAPARIDIDAEQGAVRR